MGSGGAEVKGGWVKKGKLVPQCSAFLWHFLFLFVYTQAMCNVAVSVMNTHTHAFTCTHTLTHTPFYST